MSISSEWFDLLDTDVLAAEQQIENEELRSQLIAAISEYMLYVHLMNQFVYLANFEKAKVYADKLVERFSLFGIEDIYLSVIYDALLLFCFTYSRSLALPMTDGKFIFYIGILNTATDPDRQKLLNIFTWLSKIPSNNPSNLTNEECTALQEEFNLNVKDNLDIIKYIHPKYHTVVLLNISQVERKLQNFEASDMYSAMIPSKAV